MKGARRTVPENAEHLVTLPTTSSFIDDFAVVKDCDSRANYAADQCSPKGPYKCIEAARSAVSACAGGCTNARSHPCPYPSTISLLVLQTYLIDFCTRECHLRRQPKYSIIMNFANQLVVRSIFDRT